MAWAVGKIVEIDLRIDCDGKSSGQTDGFIEVAVKAIMAANKGDGLFIVRLFDTVNALYTE